MSLEGDKERSRRDLLKGMAVGAGSATLGSLISTGVVINDGMERINSHLLTPAALHQLQQETGASERFIVNIEDRIALAVRQEIKRALRENR